jgi:serine/threonine protein kinase
MIDHNFRVKLIDFGLAKVGENGEDPFDDRHNGSLYYLAPEMLEEKGRYSYEVDVWSIGIIL